MLTCTSHLALFFSTDIMSSPVNKKHTIINDHIVDVGVGNLQGMGPSNFAAWMSGKRLSKKRIGAGAMRGMRHFVSNWDGSASPN